MTRLHILMMAGVLAAAPRVSEACRWFGTQLECEFGGNPVVVGSQAADEPTYAKSFPMHLFHGNVGFQDGGGTRSGRPFEIQLQDVGADPGLCRRIGNETYCY
jgi:hypothetical protein